jgi:acetoin utilization protein AcuB
VQELREARKLCGPREARESVGGGMGRARRMHQPLDMKPTLRKFMTTNPQTIGREQTLAVAHRVMREHRVRHLPVLEGGKLVGVISQRDLHLIETLRDVDPATTTVDEAMTMDVYVTAPNTPLDEAAQVMAEHKYGSAVVLDRGKIVGMFTTVDALHALVQILEPRPRALTGT